MSRYSIRVVGQRVFVLDSDRPVMETSVQNEHKALDIVERLNKAEDVLRLRMGAIQ